MRSILFSLGVLLLGVGTILSFVAALSIRSVSISIEAEFGIGNYLPNFFWVGFVLVMAGSVLVGWSGRSVHQILALLLVAFVMWGTPVLIEELPRHNDAFWHMATAQWVARNGQVTFSAPELFYLEYPGVFLLGAIWSMIGMSDFFVMIIYPILILVIFTLSFYLLSRKLLGVDRQAFLATLISLIGNVIMFSYHFSPSATAEALFPLMLFIILKVRESASKTSISLLFLILAFSYTLLHPAMPLVLLASVTGLYIFQRYMRLGNIAFVIAVLFLSWMVYVGVWGMNNTIDFLNNFKTALMMEMTRTPLSGLARHQTLVFPFVGLLKTGIFAGFVVCAFSAIGWQVFKHLRTKNLNEDRSIDQAVILFVIVLTAFVLSSLGTPIYGRALVWVVPFAAIVITAIHRRPTLKTLGVFMVAIILVSPLTFLSNYSGERELITTKAEYQGLSYVSANIKTTDTVLMDGSNMLDFFTRYEINYSTNPFRVSTEYGSENAPLSLKWLNSSTVVVFWEYSYAWQYYEVAGTLSNSYTDSFYEVTHDINFNTIYSDSDVVMFRRIGNLSKGWP